MDTTWNMIRIVFALIATISILGFMPRAGWLMELFSHFRVQYVAVLVPGALLAFAWGDWIFAIFVLLAGVANSLPLIPFLPIGSQALTQTGAKLLLVNVRMRNRAFGYVGQLLENEAPDLVGLVEVDEDWLKALQPLVERHGYSSVAIPNDESYGLAIFSKFRIISRSAAELGDLYGTSLICTMEIFDRPLNILAVHLKPPLTPDLLRKRNSDLTRISEWLRDSAGEWLVLGDFNATPWSPRLREFCKRAGLHSFREERGIRATWPDQFAPLRIPIDHVFGSSAVKFGQSEIKQSVRSDHLPVVMGFAIARDAGES